MIDSIFDWVLRWGEIIGAIGAAVAMVLLAILYHQQKRLLNDSFNANHRAKIEVNYNSLTDRKVVAEFSNVGNGVAIEPELVILGIYTTKDHELKHGITTNRFEREGNSDPKSASSIEKGEKEILYSSHMSLPGVWDGCRTGFRAVIREMVEYDFTICRIYLYVRYTDFTREAKVEYIDGWEFEVTKEIETPEESIVGGERIILEFPELNPKTLEYNLSEISTGKEKEVI